MELIEKFLETIGIIFDPLFGVFAVVAVVVGGFVHRKLSWSMVILVVLLTTALFFAWMSYFVFPYPPNSPPVEWMAAGYEYTDAAAILASEPRYATLSYARLNSELVHSSGGDPERVWVGNTIQRVVYTGKFLAVLWGFGLGTILPTGKVKK